MCRRLYRRRVGVDPRPERRSPTRWSARPATDNIVAFAGDDVAIGNAGADAIAAGEGADFVNGGAGRDVIFAGAGDDQVIAGADADIVYGDAGADRIFGDQGNDLINAGAGDDTVFGGAGNDLIVAEIGDGNDVYFGDEGAGGAGIDTLDMSAVTAAITVNLGSGPLVERQRVELPDRQRHALGHRERQYRLRQRHHRRRATLST